MSPVSLLERIEYQDNGLEFKTYLGALLASWVSTERELWFWDMENRLVTREIFEYEALRLRMAGKYPGGAYRTFEGMKEPPKQTKVAFCLWTCYFCRVGRLGTATEE